MLAPVAEGSGVLFDLIRALGAGMRLESLKVRYREEYAELEAREGELL